MINLINENDFFRKIISEIDIDRNKNIVIHPVISKQKIIFGYPDMLEENFKKYLYSITILYQQKAGILINLLMLNLKSDNL